MTATLHIHVDCASVDDAHTLLDRFRHAGLNTDSPKVTVAIGGSWSPERTPEDEEKITAGMKALEFRVSDEVTS